MRAAQSWVMLKTTSNFAHFDPCRGGVSEISIPIVEALNLRSNLRNTFDGCPLRGYWAWWIDKKERNKSSWVKLKAFPTNVDDDDDDDNNFSGSWRTRIRLSLGTYLWVDWKCRTGKWGTNEGPLRSKSDRHDWKMRDQISRVGKWRMSVIDYRVHQVSLGGRWLVHLVYLGHLLMYQHWLEDHLAHLEYLAHLVVPDCLVMLTDHLQLW